MTVIRLICRHADGVRTALIIFRYVSCVCSIVSAAILILIVR